MKRWILLLLLLSVVASAEVITVDYTSPSGKAAQIRLRTEAMDWVNEHVEGLQNLPEQKTTGLYYIVSTLFERIHKLDELRPVYDEIYAQMKPGDTSYSPYFVKEGIKIKIMSRQDHLTDLPEYAHWRGKTVEEVFGYKGDHRLMDDIDGEATRNTCLLKDFRVGKYPVGASNTFYHEFGHFIHMTTLKKDEFFVVEKLYLAAKAKNVFLDSYAAMSVHEYFAQGLEAYLAETKTPMDQMGAYTKSGRADLMRLDPDLGTFIATLIENY